MTEFVRLEVDGGVGTIRLDRPPMNAVNRQVNVELAQVASEAAQREDVRAVVVYGGEKTLAAGADVKEMADLTYAQMAARSRELSHGFGAVSEIPKPTVCALTAMGALKSAPGSFLTSVPTSWWRSSESTLRNTVTSSKASQDRK